MKNKYLSVLFIMFMSLLLVVCGRGYANSHDDNDESESEYQGPNDILTSQPDPEVDIYSPAPYLTDGLAAYYPFNADANDESGNGNHGTVYGAILTADRLGTLNSAYIFDGINDIIQVSHNDIVNPSQISISAWVKGNNPSGWARIVDKYRFNLKEGYNLIYNQLNGAIRFEFWATDGSKNFIVTTSRLRSDKWQHVAATYDGATMRIFYNGKLEAYATVNKTIKHTYRYLSFGNGFDDNFNWPFSGSIDEVRIYNRALSATEIRLLADRPRDHIISGKNSGWCYPLQDLCDDELNCKTPVKNIRFGFMSYNNPSYPYHLAQDMVKNVSINREYKEGDAVFAMAKGKIIRVRRTSLYGGDGGYNTMLVEYKYGAKDGSIKPVYVLYGHVKNVKGVSALPVPNKTETVVDIPISKYEKIADLNDPGAAWNHVYHLHFAVMPDTFPTDWYAGYRAVQTHNSGRVRPFNSWNNYNGWIWSKDWVDLTGYQNPANQDEVFFDTYRPK